MNTYTGCTVKYRAPSDLIANLTTASEVASSRNGSITQGMHFGELHPPFEGICLPSSVLVAMPVGMLCIRGRALERPIDLDWVPKAGRSSYGNVPIHRRGTLTVHLIMSMTERHGWRTLSREATSVRLRNERRERRIELLRACASCAVTALRRDRWENYSLLPLITAASVLALQCP